MYCIAMKTLKINANKSKNVKRIALQFNFFVSTHALHGKGQDSDDTSA